MLQILLFLGLKRSNQWQRPYNIKSGIEVSFPISFNTELLWLGATNSSYGEYDGDTEGWSDGIGAYYGSATLTSCKYSIYHDKRIINSIIIGY